MFRELLEKIPLYKELYGSLINDIHTEEDLKILPELTKEIMSKDFPNNWMTPSLKKAIEEKKYEFMTTSGTTAKRTQLIRPINWWQNEEERLFNHLNPKFPEYKNLESKAILTTAICSNMICYKETPAYEKRIINGILHLNITEDPNTWTKEDLQRMVLEIDKFKPQCFQADPIYLAIFFKLIKKHNIQLPNWTPKLLVLTYEFVPQKCKKIITRFWNIPTVILYGTTELGFLCHSDTKNNFIWMNEQNYLHLKPVDNDENIYKIIVSSFRNPYMPFINYNTKDLVTVKTNTEKSILEFVGREQDITYSHTKKPVTLGKIDNLLSKLDTNILIYILDFSYPGKIIFRFTTFDDCELKNSQKIIFLLQDIYGDKVNIELKSEKSIKPSSSGKFELIIKD